MGVEIHYYDEEPAWKIVVPDPERFRGVNYDLEIKLLRMPTGGLVAYWLRLYDVVEQPFFLHRVLDASDKAVGDYLEAIRKQEKIVLMFESPGRQGGFAVDLPVGPKGFGEVLDGALAHCEVLGEAQDGKKAVEDFLEAFNPALAEKKSVASAWERVAEVYPYQPPPEAPATRTWGGVLRLFFAALLCLAAGAAFRACTPLKENRDIEPKIVRPGYAVKLLLGENVRSIAGRWRGEKAAFTLEAGDQSLISSVSTHDDRWDEHLSEIRDWRQSPPAFRPYIEVALREAPELSGQVLEGTAFLEGVYPVFSGVAYREMRGSWKKPFRVTVFTFGQVLLARAAPVLTTAGILLSVLTVFALFGRLRAEATPGE